MITLINNKPACYLNINIIKKFFFLCEHNFDDCFDFVSFGIYDKKEIEKIKKKTYKTYQYNFPSKKIIIAKMKISKVATMKTKEKKMKKKMFQIKIIMK